MIIWNFCKALYLHRQYVKILKRVYEDENLIENLSKLFKTEFKTDWVGRIYTVINPHIQNGVFDYNGQIYEYDETGLNNQVYIESYIMGQLNIARQFINANNLFDLLTYRIEKIDDMGNYLFIIEPITYEDCKNYTKKFMYLLTGLLIIGGFLLYYFI